MLLPRKIGKRRCKKEEERKQHQCMLLPKLEGCKCGMPLHVFLRGVFQNHDEKPYLYLFRL